MMISILNAIVCATLAVLRVSGHKSQAFQAVAHLYVGGLFTAAYLQSNAEWWVLGVIVSLVELGCALWFRFSKLNS
jgi:hypothetical protein